MEVDRSSKSYWGDHDELAVDGTRVGMRTSDGPMAVL